MNIVPIPAFSDNYIWMLVQDGRAAVVDPGDAQPVLNTLASMGLALDTIIITHHHFDHTGGVTALKSETNCRVIGPDNPKIQGIDQVLSEGQSVSALGYAFEILEVPGHTLDHIALYCRHESVLFCGDTLFVGGCGRVF
jgi:hydroxyacylglutathione hydrolase